MNIKYNSEKGLQLRSTASSTGTYPSSTVTLLNPNSSKVKAKVICQEAKAQMLTGLCQESLPIVGYYVFIDCYIVILIVIMYLSTIILLF